ncbi:MAG: hypothetical protein PW792_03805 [Acidobacteriaceae bacterium]|nr:hypothetical protein [Acidobacteriaceae bacterium]
MSASSSSDMVTGAKLQGNVHGGQQPVSGATIQLYQVGTTGYSSAAKPLLTTTVTSDSNGNFNLTGDYSCETGGYVYLTASGGDPGSGANNALALMTALGPCASLTSTTYVSINELTTVAAAYALAQFGRQSTFGTTLIQKAGAAASGSTAATAPADNFSTSAANIQGLVNAMSTASVLVNPNTGAAPGNNSNGTATVEYWTLNLLADMLASCVNSNGSTASGSNCSTLFSDVTPSGSTAPADTIQAALYMALNPNLGSTAISSLYSLVTSTPPFVPVPASASAVTDLTVGIAYTPVNPFSAAKVLSVPNSLAVDGAGNVWVTNIGTGYPVTELDPIGNPVQAGSVSGYYSVTNYSVGGTSTAISGGGSYVPTTSSAAGVSIPYSVAIDTIGNAWIADYSGNSIFMITGSGGIAGGANGGGATCGSASCGSSSAVGYNIQTSGGLANSYPTAVAVDGSNNVWFTMNGSTTPTGSCGSLGLASKGIGEFVAGSYGTYVQGGWGTTTSLSIALDSGTNDTYTPSGGSATTIPGSPFVWTIGEQGGGTLDGHSYYGQIGQYYRSTSGSTIKPGCSSTLNFISSANASTTPTTKIPTLTSGSDTINAMGTPYALAFDHSGAIWIVNNWYSDTSEGVAHSVTKVVPGYGTAFTAASASAAFTFSNYISLGSASSTLTSTQFLAVDGGGNVWVTGSGSGTAATAAIIELSNSATLISSSKGFVGASYTSGSTTSQRFSLANVNHGVAIDGSGNVWIANGSAGSGTVTVVVGAAVPVVTPLSVAVGNNTVGTMP